jgi:hypothetical protein
MSDRREIHTVIRVPEWDYLAVNEIVLYEAAA